MHEAAHQPETEALAFQSYPTQPQYPEYPAQAYPTYHETVTAPAEAVPLVGGIHDGMMVRVTVGFIRSLEDELGRSGPKCIVLEH